MAGETDEPGGSGLTLRVEWVPDQRDVAVVRPVLLRRQAVAQRPWIIVALASGEVLAIAVILNLFDTPGYWGWLAFLGLVGWAVASVMRNRAQRRINRHRVIGNGEPEVVAMGDTLTWSRAGVSTSVEWARLELTSDRRTSATVLLAGGQVQVVVPAHVFGTAADQQAFEAEIRRRIDTARTSLAPGDPPPQVDESGPP